MSTFNHGGLTSSMGPSPGACLQQRDSPGMGGPMSGYCMGRPPSYDLGLGYGSRPSPCSPTQPYQMNGHQYNTNGTSSTGSFIFKRNDLEMLICRFRTNISRGVGTNCSAGANGHDGPVLATTSVTMVAVDARCGLYLDIFAMYISDFKLELNSTLICSLDGCVQCCVDL